MNIEPGYYKLRIVMQMKDDSVAVTYVEVEARSSVQLTREIEWAKRAHSEGTVDGGVKVTHSFVRSIRDRGTDQDYLE